MVRSTHLDERRQPTCARFGQRGKFRREQSASSTLWGLLGVSTTGSIAKHEAAQHLRACDIWVCGYTNNTDLEKYALHSVRVGA